MDKAEGASPPDVSQRITVLLVALVIGKWFSRQPIADVFDPQGWLIRFFFI